MANVQELEAVKRREPDKGFVRWFDRAVEAWLRHTTDELNVQESRHPRWFVSRREAA